jgi:hypothetical protein
MYESQLFVKYPTGVHRKLLSQKIEQWSFTGLEKESILLVNLKRAQSELTRVRIQPKKITIAGRKAFLELDNLLATLDIYEQISMDALKEIMAGNSYNSEELEAEGLNEFEGSGNKISNIEIDKANL